MSGPIAANPDGSDTGCRIRGYLGVFIMRTASSKPSPYRRLVPGLFAALGCIGSLLLAAERTTAAPELDVAYGQNARAGHFLTVNGIRLYYETYGTGPAMLVIHGNGQSIRELGHQIRFFSKNYRVVAADSRGHGQSEMGDPPLTYEQMAEDLNAMLDNLALKSVRVLGWSDGGILGLLLAIHHPDKVSKLAIMGANLEPSGAHDWALNSVEAQERIVDQKIAANDTSRLWAKRKQYLGLLGRQPHISLNDLHRITAPTLVMAADRDVIRNEHTLSIFENIANAHLCIFPGATHMIPSEDPATFNQTVERFFKAAFTRPDTQDLFSP
jgi:pimeloyl-ACP methyl ester carboxylesterase